MVSLDDETDAADVIGAATAAAGLGLAAILLAFSYFGLAVAWIFFSFSSSITTFAAAAWKMASSAFSYSVLALLTLYF